MADSLVHADGTRYAWLVNPSREPVTAAVVFPGPAIDVRTSLPIGDTVTIPALGVVVARIAATG